MCEHLSTIKGGGGWSELKWLDNAAVRAPDKCSLPGSERRRLILRIDAEDRIMKKSWESWMMENPRVPAADKHPQAAMKATVMSWSAAPLVM